MLELINPALIGGVTAAAVFVGILVALKLGRWLGQRAIASDGRAVQPNVGSLEAAVFALLGLLIAFTFSGALQRFDARRVQVVDEANAIGTAWARVDLLPPAAQPPVRAAMKAYVDSRVATYQKINDVPAARQEAERSLALQGALWAAAVTALRNPETRPGTEILLAPALNDVFNCTTIRFTAMQMHPP